MTDKQQNHDSLIVRGFRYDTIYTNTIDTKKHWHDNNYNKATFSDVNKATSHKAKARELKA